MSYWHHRFKFQKHKYYRRFENSTKSDARRKDNFYKKYVEESGTDVLSDFSRLNVYVEDEEVTKTIETPAMIMSQLLSEIGGQLGIWIGVSIITFAEMIELVVVLVSTLREKRRKKETNKEKGKELDEIDPLGDNPETDQRI